jgi:adenylylsulfate kinase
MRVLVVTGTLGAGKTFVAAAVRDVLAARGERVAVIDLDWLCQRDPAPVDDPYNDALCFRNLAAVWPNYAAEGVQFLLLARVVGERSHRGRYESAMPGADVRIVRVEASPQTCRHRLVDREPEGHWRKGHVSRTETLAIRLAALAVEDFVVGNDSRAGPDVAREIVSKLGW